jgi:threonine synthase
MSSSSSVTYSSTRGGETRLDFRTVVMQGLARDRGLFVPDRIPTVTLDELKAWRNLTFPDLAVQVLRKFIHDDQVPFEKLRDIVHRSCAAFAEPNIVTPVVPVGGHYILVSAALYKQLECDSTGSL